MRFVPEIYHQCEVILHSFVSHMQEHFFTTCTSSRTRLTMVFRSGNRFRGSGKNGGSKSPGPGQSSNSPTSPTSGYQSSLNSSTSNLAPRVPPLPNSPSLSQTISLEQQQASNQPADILSHYNLPRPKPIWLNVNYAQHIVKGNFMTLSARPKTVEQGEWIAHQG